MLILIASVILVIPLVTKIKTTTIDASKDQSCKIAITNAAYAKKIGGGTTAGLPGILTCKREILTINKKDVVTTLAAAEQSDTEKFLSAFTGAAVTNQPKNLEVLNQDKIAKIIADNMAQCWDQYGAGKLDPFSDWGDDEKSYCAICKTIRFDQDLRTFIQENNPPPTASQEEKTFYEKNYLPQSPALWMMTHQTKPNGPTYWEYLYKQNPKQLSISKEDINNMAHSAVLEGSHLLLRMYKLETKSRFKEATQIATPIIGGLTIAVGVITFLPSFGASTTLIIGGVALVGGALATNYLTSNIAFIGGAFTETFRDCPECNALGGLYLVPFDQALNIKQTTTIKNNDKEESKDIVLCNELVN